MLSLLWTPSNKVVCHALSIRRERARENKRKEDAEWQQEEKGSKVLEKGRKENSKEYEESNGGNYLQSNHELPSL